MKRVTRRAATIAGVLALTVWITWSAVALQRATAARARARARAAQVGATSSGGPAFAAADDHAARAALSAWVGDKAAATAIRVSLAPLASAFPGEVRLRLAARGDEPSLRRFARAIEAPALLRLGHWTMTAAADGSLALSADIAADWRAAAPALPVAPVPPPESGRRLFSGTITDAAPAAGDKPELVGIAGRIPNDAVAILRIADGTTRTIGRGGVVGGWQVTTIASDRVTLVRSGRTFVAVLPPNSR